MKSPSTVLLAVILACVALPAQAQVKRHPIPHSSFPISAAVEVPPGHTMVYLSGMVPPVVDANAPKGSAAVYGTTETQTVGVLKRIQGQLRRLGLGMGDVVSMHVFLVADPANRGKLDFAGFMKGYTQFFGTKAQPRLPVRSAVQVAALAGPGMLVEIEVTAVRP